MANPTNPTPPKVTKHVFSRSSKRAGKQVFLHGPGVSVPDVLTPPPLPPKEPKSAIASRSKPAGKPSHIVQGRSHKVPRLAGLDLAKAEGNARKATESATLLFHGPTAIKWFFRGRLLARDRVNLKLCIGGGFCTANGLWPILEAT